MQIPSEEKRRRIRRAAAELFAARPYHEVLLSDIAAAAGVGKGTIYVYFESKDNLYLSVHLEDFAALMDALEARADEAEDPVVGLGAILRALVRHVFESPHVFEVLRTVGIPACRSPFREQYSRLTALIERVIRSGIEAGCFADPRPDLTAVCVPGLVRAALLHGPQGLSAGEVADHLLGLLLSALAKR